MTVRDLITGSLRLLGALAVGEVPSANEQTDAFNALVDMLDSWSTEDLVVYAKTIEQFSLAAGQASYQMGPGGDFNTVRPLGLDGAGVQAGTSEYPIKILTLDGWETVQQKSTQSTYPTKLYPSETYPALTLIFWPVPSAIVPVNLYTWKPLTDFASVGATISLPPGYARALRYNLACELAPEYGIAPPPKVEQIAMESKANIKRKNIKPRVMGTDPAVSRRRRFNIFTGE